MSASTKVKPAGSLAVRALAALAAAMVLVLLLNQRVLSSSAHDLGPSSGQAMSSGPLIQEQNRTGTAGERQPGATPEPLPPIRRPLPLELRGTIGAGGDGSLAIIVTGDGVERAYRSGADVGYGATLAAIDRDRVYIRTEDGSLETLRMAGAGVPAQEGQASASDPRDMTPWTGTVARNGERPDIGKNPVSLLPVERNGHIIGYELRPSGKMRRRFSALGLRSGDVLLAINGSPVNDAQQAELFTTYLNARESFDVIVQRNGKERHVTVGGAG